ncbi:MAG: hypothetical protein AB1765_02900 [Candidatus Hydrogenedentota bacterium]
MGLDLDNILADFVSTFLEFVYVKTGERYRVAEIKDYSLQKALGMSEPLMDTILNEFNNENKWKDIPLIEDARRFIDELKKMRKSIVVVTSRPSVSVFETRRWFIKNRILVDDILVADRTPKSRVIRKSGYKFDFFVDDGLHFAFDISKVVQRVYLLTCPWNMKNSFKSHRVIRIKKLSEILKIEKDNL